MVVSAEHVSHGKVFLGHTGGFSLKPPSLSDYLRMSDAAFPAVCAWERPIEWGMLGNDAVGDCVIAWMLHHIRAMMAVAHAGDPINFNTTFAIQLYSMLTGYKPGDESTDNGTDPDAACAFWKAQGINGDKIAGYANLDISNVNLLKFCIYNFGGIGLSFGVPRYIMDIPAGGSWDYTGGDQTQIGGHQILLIGYGRQGFRCVSWGTTYTFSPDFIGKNAFAAQAVISPSWIKASGKAPSGLDMAGLLVDLGAA